MIFKNLANIITISRIISGILILFSPPFSTIFWISYLYGGISDIIDGKIAQKLNQQTKKGAKLDSMADLIFTAALACVIFINIHLTVLLWISIGCVLVLRLTGYAVGAFKYHTFSALHTYANKITGLLIFLFPVFHSFPGLNEIGIILAITAFASTNEEILIILKSDKLDVDCKGLFFK